MADMRDDPIAMAGLARNMTRDEYLRHLNEGTLPPDRRADWAEMRRRNITEAELMAERAAYRGRGASAVTPATPSPSPRRAVAMPVEDMAYPADYAAYPVRRGAGASFAEATPAAPVDYAEDVSGMRGLGVSRNEVQRVLARNRAQRQNQRNLPTTRMTPAVSEADALNQRELDRIAADRGVLSGGDIQPRELNLDERIGASMDRTLGRIGLRRTNETGEGAPSTGSFREDLRGLGRALGLKKGGKVKKMAKGGVVKAPSASRRGDGIAARGKTKGRMV